jgi:phosphohistidine phosphatase
MPEADPQVAAAALANALAPLALVGHLPHLARLATLLVRGAASGDVVQLPRGTAVCLERHETAWIVAWTLEPPAPPAGR